MAEEHRPILTQANDIVSRRKRIAAMSADLDRMLAEREGLGVIEGHVGEMAKVFTDAKPRLLAIALTGTFNSRADAEVAAASAVRAIGGDAALAEIYEQEV